MTAGSLAASVTVSEAEHVIRLDTNHFGAYVRAVCSCDWSRWGANYPTRTVEGRRLAEQDGEMHLRNPQIPAFKPDCPSA